MKKLKLILFLLFISLVGVSIAYCVNLVNNQQMCGEPVINRNRLMTLTGNQQINVTALPSLPKDNNSVFKIIKSMIKFYPGRWLEELEVGYLFNYSIIAADNFGPESELINVQNPIVLSDVDETGVIAAFNDGRKMPLVFGSIPSTEDDIRLLKKEFGVQHINILSINLPFERDWSGLSKLVASDSTLKLFKFFAIDYCAPSFIEILKAVYLLINRDILLDGDLAFIHCKAGKGRSFVVVACYIGTLLFDNGITNITPAQLKQYIKKRRPNIKPNAGQMAAIGDYLNRLKILGGFENMYKYYAGEIQERGLANNYC